MAPTTKKRTVTKSAVSVVTCFKCCKQDPQCIINNSSIDDDHHPSHTFSLRGSTVGSTVGSCMHSTVSSPRTTPNATTKELFQGGKIHTSSKQRLFAKRFSKNDDDIVNISPKLSRYFGFYEMPQPRRVSDTVRQVIFSSLWWFLIFYIVFIFILLCGAQLLHLNESPEEEKLKEEYLKERKKIFFALYKRGREEKQRLQSNTQLSGSTMSTTPNANMSNDTTMGDNHTTMSEYQIFIIDQIKNYTAALRKLYFQHGYDPRLGPHRDTEQAWSFRGAILHMSGILSIESFKELKVRSNAGLLQDILCVLVGLPVHALLLNQAGFLLSTAITLVCRVTIPRFWWEKVRGRQIAVQNIPNRIIMADPCMNVCQDQNVQSDQDTVQTNNDPWIDHDSLCTSDFIQPCSHRRAARRRREALLFSFLQQTPLLKEPIYQDKLCPRCENSGLAGYRSIHTPLGLLKPTGRHPCRMVLHADRSLLDYVDLEDGQYCMHVCSAKNCVLCQPKSADELMSAETLNIFNYRTPELALTVVMWLLYELVFASYIYYTTDDDVPFYEAMYFSMASLTTVGVSGFNKPMFYDKPLRFRLIPLMLFRHWGFVILAACFQPRPRPTSLIVVGNVINRIPDLLPAFIIDYFRKQKKLSTHLQESYYLRDMSKAEHGPF